MKKLLIFFIMFIIYINSVISLDECNAVMVSEDVPCRILLPLNTSKTSCGDVNVSIFRNSTLVDSQFMIEVNEFFCQGNFSEEEITTYTIVYSTGDSGSITIQENFTNKLLIAALFIFMFFILLFLGIKTEEPSFYILGGMFLTILGIDIYINGFPKLENEMLRNSITVLIIGTGMFFMLGPLIDWLENNFYDLRRI